MSVEHYMKIETNATVSKYVLLLYIYLRACREQVLFLAASVCLSTQNLENYWTEIDVTW